MYHAALLLLTVSKRIHLGFIVLHTCNASGHGALEARHAAATGQPTRLV